MKKISLSSKPPRLINDENKLNEFIMGADKNNISTNQYENDFKNSVNFPWENPSVRNDVLKTFNLRLPEEYFIKLNYLSEIKKVSKQKICLDILLNEIDRKLNIK